MNYKKNKGFTLIELLVVIAIISLLSSVVLASLKTARIKANDSKILAEYQQLRIALEIYYNENGKYPTPSNPGNYCIAQSVSDCSIAGVTITQTLNHALGLSASNILDYPPKFSISNQRNNLLAAPLFTYTPSIVTGPSGNKGFVYQKPTGSNPSPKIIFATEKRGAVNATVGTWTLSNGTN